MQDHTLQNRRRLTPPPDDASKPLYLHHNSRRLGAPRASFDGNSTVPNNRSGFVGLSLMHIAMSLRSQNSKTPVSPGEKLRRRLVSADGTMATHLPMALFPSPHHPSNPGSATNHSGCTHNTSIDITAPQQPWRHRRSIV